MAVFPASHVSAEKKYRQESTYPHYHNNLYLAATTGACSLRSPYLLVLHVVLFGVTRSYTADNFRHLPPVSGEPTRVHLASHY